MIKTVPQKNFSMPFSFGFILIASAFLLAGFGPAFSAPTKKISYTFEYMMGETPKVFITLEFEGDESGRTPLSLPMNWGGQVDLYKALSGYNCHNNGCRIEPSDVPTALYVFHEPGELVEITYVVKQDWSGDFNNSNYYRAHLTDDYLFMIGHAMLVTPDNYQGFPVELTFAWQNLPKEWAVMTSFGTGTSFKTVVPDIDEMRAATYTAGNYRVFGDEIRGVYTFVAIRGDWPFEDKAFAKLTTGVIRNIRRFWKDYNADQFLVTLIPTDGKCCSLGGTSLTDSFTLFVTGDGADLKGLEWLLSHELLHSWIGGMLRLDGPEEQGYWFSEGFTNYYSRLLRLRGGQLTLAEYVEDYNAKLAEYFMSPARNETLADVEAKFWTDKNTGQLPYLRGDILAHNWNAGIKDDADGTSLDTVMKDLMKLGEDEIALARFDKAMERHLERSIIPDVENYLVAGNTIDLDPEALGACFSVVEVEKIPFDLGFNHPDSPKKDVYWEISSVVPGSPAEVAGFKPGMEVVGYNFYWGDIDNPVEIWVREGEERIKLSFLAHGKPVMIPQYVLDEREWRKNREECEAWFLAN